MFDMLSMLQLVVRHPWAPAGLRRAHKEAEGECEASECNLLCEDMLRAGFSRFVVDPGVRQAYFPDTARQLYTKKARCTLWSPQMSATKGARF